MNSIKLLLILSIFCLSYCDYYQSGVNLNSGVEAQIICPLVCRYHGGWANRGLNHSCLGYYQEPWKKPNLCLCNEHNCISKQEQCAMQ